MTKQVPRVPRQPCSAMAKSTQEPCKEDAIPGGTVCLSHGGAAPQVRSRALVKAQVWEWDAENDITDDPAETLLIMLSQSRRRANLYALEIETTIGEQTLQAALEKNKHLKTLVKLEADERERCARWSAAAIGAGLKEREVRLKEQQEDQAVELLQIALTELGIDRDRQIEVIVAAHHKMNAIDVESTSKELQ